jgi:hemoglobin
METALDQRLGGDDVIAAVVDELFAPLRADPRFSRFGMGWRVDQICQLAGGPFFKGGATFYVGRDMKTSHAGLGITDRERQIKLDYTRHALLKQAMGAREQTGFLALVRTL